MPFTAPKTTAFKQFVVLDHDGVVAALSAIDGGQIDQILKRSAEEGTGSAGGEVNLKVAKGGGKRAKTRKVEEEIRLARTRHAAAAKLIDALEAREAVGVVDGAFNEEVLGEIETGMVLRFRAELKLHPLHQADGMLRSFIEVAPKLGQGQSVRELKESLKIWEVMVRTGDPDSRVLTEPRTTEPQVPRLLLPIPKTDLEVPVEDVLGDVTILAQVDQILGNAESYQAMRMLSGGPASILERDSIAETVPDMLPALKEIGVEIAETDIFISGPAVLLRPICAYR